MKKELLILASVIVFAFLIVNVSAVFIGLTDGYIKGYTGSAISGAAVTATVSSCSGGVSNGCTGTATSESDGYYIVANLNLPKNGAASITATEGTGSGSNTGSANSFQIVHINISVCYPPSSPTLTAISDSHNTTADFIWVSGTDPYSRATNDQFSLDSNVTNQSSPITRTSLTAGSHTWQVRTCNVECCSSYASDTFIITNTNPTAPTNANATFHLTANITSFTWTSGTDADGDAIYDEFRYENGTIASPAASPFNVSTELVYSWAVRTCDSFGGCSSWLETESVNCSTCASCTVCSTTTTECTATSTTGGNSRGGTNLGCESPKKAELFCNGIQFSNETLLRIKLNFRDGKNKLSISGINYNLENIEYCPWCYDGIKDYDESQVDCGGSCRSCTPLEQRISSTIEQYIPKKIMILIIVLIIALCAYLLYLIIDIIINLFKLKNQEESQS